MTDSTGEIPHEVIRQKVKFTAPPSSPRSTKLGYSASRSATAEGCFFSLSRNTYIHMHIISHNVSIKSVSFLQIFTCWKIILRTQKLSQTKISFWVLLKRTTTWVVIWHRPDGRWQPREKIQESLRMRQFLLFWTAPVSPELDSKCSLGGAAKEHAAQLYSRWWYRWPTVSAELYHMKQL